MRMQEVSREAPFRRTCAWCGAEFGAASPQAEYCSHAHKQAHYRWRSKVVEHAKTARRQIDALKPYLEHGGEVESSARTQLEVTIKYAQSLLSSHEFEKKNQKKEKVVS